ncbi:oligoribonuclease [Gulosibacter molinativorax]|uniref:Oligoribonuclease n=1 Tax=Gulosibacter molinativorax TaxID=256821 RepID=A0ABT7C9N2_9MICO|nr:oligoribonuclease [Gulosibacter molinativorax]MDJ1371818.1 oligoribonuclease [Gulosibacter molinativorax]QUY60810.1 Oligoribonuclease [Gulosibacter molinativorax]
MTTAQDRLVWIDCEMTGLEVDVDEICEIAVFVTDFELNLLDDKGLDVVIKPSQSALDNMNEFVTNMHTTSGLINEFESGVTMAEAEEQVLTYIKQFVPAERTAPLAGNTIGTDRMFINRQMPGLDAYLHYRNIDVSTFKELSRRWYPRIYFNAPEKNGGHRATADILESIRELRYYREAMCVPQPGPDSKSLKTMSTSVVEAFSPYLQK